MRIFTTAPQRILLLMIMVIAVPAAGFSLESTTHVWTFDQDSSETLPSEFHVGTLFDGRPAGEWRVLETDQAKSPLRVLGQLMRKGAEHAYKTALIDKITASDLDLQVSLLPIDGKADMGGGLVWRAADDRNYYLTRANPLEQNIRIYRVVKGVRHLIQNFDQIIDVRQWHTLHVITKGCQVQVFFDDKQVFDLCDQTFTTGQVGLWTKSDAITYFDDLKLQVVR